MLDLNLKDIMIKAIIFDFNGTMIFDQEILEKSWTLFLKNLIHRNQLMKNSPTTFMEEI